MPNKVKTVGIIGGIGPEATVDTFRWIVNLTPAKGDHDHIPVLVYNNPQVPSRVDAILFDGESPVPTLIKMAKSLEEMGADFLIMPCNTAHFYIDKVQKKVGIPIINMIDETSNYIVSCRPQTNLVGLLATEMTLRTGIYQENLVSKMLEYNHKEIPEYVVNEILRRVKSRYTPIVGVEETDEDQHNVVTSIVDDPEMTIISPAKKLQDQKVTKAIFGRKGIKSGYYGEPKKLLTEASNHLKSKGVKQIILGCTEIPLALFQEDVDGVELVNPTKILAQTAVDIALGKKPLPKINKDSD